MNLRILHIRLALPLCYWALLLCLVCPAVSAQAQPDQWEPASAGLGSLDVRALAVGPDGTLYAGTWGDGVYRSADRGASWSRVGDTLDLPRVEHLAVDQQGYVYATGQPPIDDRPSQLYLLPPGSDSWQTIATGVGIDFFWGLGLGPDDSVYVYFNKEAGAGAEQPNHLKLTNHGQTVTPLGGEANFLCYAFDLNTVFVGTSTLIGALVMWSDDGFKTTQVNILGEQGMATDVSALIFDESGRLYAASNEDGGRVFESADRGHTWTPINQGLPPATSPQSGGYINAFTIRQPGELFLARGSYPFSGSTPVPEWGVFRRADPAVGWQDVSRGLTNRDVRALIAAPDGTLYAGTAGGGIYRSTWSVPVKVSSFQAE